MNLGRFKRLFKSAEHQQFMLSGAGSIALFFLYTMGLSQSYLFDVDEGAFTEATREMLQTKDWLHTTLNGVDRFDKPIGVYWLQAVSAWLFGLNEFAFRLPSALSGFLASLAMARFAFQQWGYRAAWTAAIVCATSLGPWAMARTATADALLGLFFVLIFIDLWRALENQSRSHGRRVAFWTGLGLLVKGPIAVIVPTGTLLLGALLVPVHRQSIKRFIRDPYAWLILFSVFLPWYLYAYLRHGQLFIDGFLLKHNIERFTGSLEGHSGHWTYFLLALPLLWFPWSALWVSVLLDVRRCLKDRLLQYAWLWFAFVFAFFTLSNTKLPHYLLYAGPAMCLLVTSSTLNAKPWAWYCSWLLGVLGFAVILWLPSLLQAHLEWITDPYYKALIANSPETDMKVWVFVFPLLYLCFSGVRLFLQKYALSIDFNGKHAEFLLFACFQTVVLALVVLPWWATSLQSPVYKLASHFQSAPGTVVQWGLHMPSFATYRQHEAPRREPDAGEMALVKNIAPYWPSDWLVLESQGPLSVIKRPLETSGKP
jgi:4-amino-4-deoxy-L-arabinose transferase-like glycosyltransferase